MSAHLQGLKLGYISNSDPTPGPYLYLTHTLILNFVFADVIAAIW